MKEDGPERKVETSGLKETIRVLALMGLIVISSTVLAKVLRVINPPEAKMEISVKMSKPEKDKPPLPVVEFKKKCIDRVIAVMPAGHSRTFYKDCD